MDTLQFSNTHNLVKILRFSILILIFILPACSSPASPPTAPPVAESTIEQPIYHSQACSDYINKALEDIIYPGSMDDPGNKLSDIVALGDGESCYQDYERLTILNVRNVGIVKITYPEIRDKWKELGLEKGVLGYPTDDRGPINGFMDPQGKISKAEYQVFTNGTIYFNPDSGAHELHGSIRDKYKELGLSEKIGFPETDVIPATDGSGSVAHFQDGTIYGTNQGTYYIHGLIRNKFAVLGWEASYLGYPISDEIVISETARLSRFENGVIFLTDEKGPVDIKLDRTVPNYAFYLEKFKIMTTRSIHEDTDYVGLQVNSPGLPSPVQLTKPMGDVNDGSHYVGLDFLPIPLEDTNKEVLITYEIVNSGGEPNAALSGLKDSIRVAADVFLGSGELISWIWDLVVADCDGIVAADQIHATGIMLDQWTSNKPGFYSKTLPYPAKDQPTFCNPSFYAVTWHIIRL